MKVVEVKGKILLTDQFIIGRTSDFNPLIITEDDIVFDANNLVITGQDLQDFTLSLQQDFLNDLNIKVGNLEDIYVNGYRKFNPITSQFEEVEGLVPQLQIIKSNHMAFYGSATDNLVDINNDLVRTRVDYNESYDRYRLLSTGAWRYARNFHILDPNYNDALVDGQAQLLSAVDGAAFSNKYEDVKTIHMSVTDLERNKRDFYAVFPADLIEIRGKTLVNPIGDAGGLVDEKLIEQVEYRVVYRVDTGYDPYSQTGNPYQDIPVTHVGGEVGDMKLSFNVLNASDLPLDYGGNKNDYLYHTFSLNCFPQTKQLVTLEKLYKDYIQTSPVGSIIMWPNDPATIDPKYGKWVICDGVADPNYNGPRSDFNDFMSDVGLSNVPNVKDSYFVMAGNNVDKDGNDIEYNYNLNVRFNGARTAEPNAGAYVNLDGEHTHVTDFFTGGSHSHYLGNKKYGGGAKKAITSCRASNQKKDWNASPTGSNHTTNDPTNESDGSNKHVHTLRIDENKNIGNLKADHKHIAEGWDDQNRMNSITYNMMMKVEHPPKILEIEQRLKDLGLL